MNPIRILLVDDSKSARYALRLQLQRNEIQVDTADSAEAALERIKAEPPDAVFMDHTMPGMNGLEALDILKAGPSTTAIPVVMCTSNEDPEYLEQAKKKGALDVLAKSAATDKLPSLLARVREALSGVPTPTPQPPSAPPEMDMAAVSALIQREASRLVDERLNAVQQELRQSIPPAMDTAAISEQLRREATPAVEERLDAVLDQHIEAALMPMLAEFGDRLSSDIKAQAEFTLDESLKAESKLLNERFKEAQKEQTELVANLLKAEILPQAIAQQFKRERNKLAQMVQGLIDVSLDTLTEETKFMNQVLEMAESAARKSGEKAARIQAQEVAQQISKDQADAMANGFVDASKSRSGTMYLLAALAALAGIGASGVVYLLLSS